jgi:hypothetical protein
MVIVAMLLVAAVAVGGIGLFGAAPTSADHNEQRVLRFVAQSDAGVDDNEVHHRIAMTGDGEFTSDHVDAGGTFVHFNQDTPETPKDIIASGTWEARKVLSYERGFGTYGNIDAGILEIEIDLFPDEGPKTQAVLRLVCNIGAGGITTGEPEGYTLTVPSAGLTFEPLDPVSGLTHLGVPRSGDNDEGDG